MPRTKRVDSERDLEREVDDYKTRGFKIKHQGNQSAKVKDKDYGDTITHGFIFLFALIAATLLLDSVSTPAGTVWVIALLVNAVYAAYSWFTAEEIMIKVDSSAD